MTVHAADYIRFQNALGPHEILSSDKALNLNLAIIVHDTRVDKGLAVEAQCEDETDPKKPLKLLTFEVPPAQNSVSLFLKNEQIPLVRHISLTNTSNRDFTLAYIAFGPPLE